MALHERVLYACGIHTQSSCRCLEGARRTRVGTTPCPEPGCCLVPSTVPCGPIPAAEPLRPGSDPKLPTFDPRQTR